MKLSLFMDMSNTIVSSFIIISIDSLYVSIDQDKVYDVCILINVTELLNSVIGLQHQISYLYCHVF